MAKTKLPEPQAPEIEARVRKAQDDLAIMRVEIEQVALKAASGDPAASTRYAELKDKIRVANGEIEMLTAAHAAALREDANERDAAKASARKSRINTVRQAFSSYEKAAERLAKALYQANMERKICIAEGARARQALSELGCDLTFQDVSLVLPENVDRLIANELYRITADVMEGRSSWPKPEMKSLDYQHNPQGQPTMTAEVERAHAWAFAKLEGTPLPEPRKPTKPLAASVVEAVKSAVPAAPVQPVYPSADYEAAGIRVGAPRSKAGMEHMASSDKAQ